MSAATLIPTGLAPRAGRGRAAVATAALVLAWALYLVLVLTPRGAAAHDAVATPFGALPLVAAAVCMLVAGPRVRGLGAGTWLDGAIAMLAVGAVGTAVLGPQIAAAGAAAPGLATSIAPPLGDLLIVALVAGACALSAWRPGRWRAVIGAGLALLAVADLLVAHLAAQGALARTGWLSAIWPASMVLLAIAAWRMPSRPRTRPADAPALLAVPIPLALTLASVGVLAYGNVATVHPAALLLAGATVAAAVLRLVLSFREVLVLADSSRQATTDELTGLPNRRHFYAQLRRELETARADGSPLTLLIADLDGFKELNDTLGHHTGDLLLQQLGPRVLGTLSAGDTLARLGGDEFGILLPGCDGAAATAIAQRITTVLEEPFTLRGLNLHVEASIGVAAYPEHAYGIDALVSRADVAMYEAKGARTGFEVYAATRDTHSRDRLELLGDLRRAIDEREFELHYQPKIELRGGTVEGVEALLRWRHPTRGLIGPTEFIPLAERTTLMRPLTLLVLDMALEQCRRWRDDGLDLSVAVNLAVPNLLDFGLPFDVLELLQRWEVPPDRLNLEVTENVILANPGRIIGVLKALRKIGVSLSLDDFGTGSSALAHLKHLPIDELKIDRSFVMAMESSPADEVIVRSTTQLAQRLGLRVVAEGVESVRALELVERIGCEVAQGHLLQRPLTAEALAPWLEARRATLSAWKADSEDSSATLRS